ncbi:alpha/beta hydrolase fold protein [Catellatospora methionotrophica]|uniref:Alpha/beta hydrolase fold protein n=1 Tax=Catellatospora methionotrophica TaxID=121620 RepID=A0A8J3LLB9_9ACTN|nr:alpha/beta fold hydrolase [Catellatospora methionotrophica]GIG16705.1 alpha/beta hydrolase fold protein [Catellatospora methionotrophica]
MRKAAGLAYVRCGVGPRLLLMQGAAATHRHWGDGFLSALAAHFEVVAVDHRGTGQSAAADGPFTVADLADDAAGLLDAVGWSSAHVAGVSMGGMVAQELAMRHPGRVASLFLGCTRGGRPLPRPAAAAGVAAAVVRGDASATAYNLFRLGVRDPGTVRPDAWAEYRDAMLTTPVPPRTTALQIGAMSAHGPADRLHLVTAPTTVVHGDTDRLLAADAGAQLAAEIPGARFVLLRAGHLFWLEQPEQAADLIRRGAARA